jgi:hypothetical protein
MLIIHYAIYNEALKFYYQYPHTHTGHAEFNDP